MRWAVIVLSLLCGVSPAFAQSNPGLVYQQVPTAAQWNSYFALKADSVNGTLNNPSITGGSQTTIQANASGALSVASNSPIEGIYGTGGGALVSMCPGYNFGCNTAINNINSEFTAVATSLGNAATQETSIYAYMAAGTGAAINWSTNTGYAANAVVVAASGANLYITSAACTSASSGSGPTGTGSFVDNTCNWHFIGSAGLRGKIALAATTLTNPGGSQTWAGDFDNFIEPGWSEGFATGAEIDVTNNSGRDANGVSLTIPDLYLGGSVGTNPITCYICMSPFGLNGSNMMAHEGLWTQGQYTIAGHDIRSSTNSLAVLFADAAGTHTTATIYDGSTANSGIILAGTYTNNIAMQVVAGDHICFSLTDACFYHSGSNFAYEQGGTNFMSITDGTGNANFISIDNVLHCGQFSSLQACHDALPSTGGHMIMSPNTTYAMTSRLNITKPNVVFECPSWNTIIQRAGSFGQQLIQASGTGDEIINCTFDGNGTTYTGSYGEVQISGANDVLQGNQFINSGGGIMASASGANSRVTGNTLTGLSLNANQYGVWAINHVTVTVDSNTITGAGIDGIGFDGDGSKVVNNRLSGNHCYTGSQGGQIVQYGTNHNQLISGNTIGAGCAIGATGAAGIELGTGNDITVVGNSVYDQTNNGIIVDPAVVGALISGNTIENSGQSGSGPYAIAVYSNASQIKITGNRIIDNQGSPTQTYGVYLFGGTTSNVQITDNDFLGTPTPITNLAPAVGVYIAGNTGTSSAAAAGSSDNRVRNPCGAIDQPQEGTIYSQAGGNTYVMDGFLRTTSNSSFSIQRTSYTSAPGCSTSLHMISQVTRTPGSTDFYLLSQNIMGSDLQDLNWGTALAKPVIVDFCVKASFSGTMPFVLKLPTAGVYYATTYAVTANTQTCPSIQIPALTTSSVANSNAIAASLIWDGGSGSNQLTSTTGAWTSGNSTGVVGETLFNAQTVGSTLDITSIRFFPSTGDMPWAPRSLNDELAKVSQFYQKSFSAGTAVAQNAGATGSIGLTAPYAQATFGTVSIPISFSSVMRAAPTVTFYSTGAASANCYDTTKAADAGAAAATNIGTNSMTATCTLASGDALGDLLNVQFALDARI